MRRSSCENVLGLPGNHASTKSTILPVCYLTTTPLPLSIFTTAIPSGPQRTHWRGGASTGQLRRPDQSLPTPKCESISIEARVRDAGQRKRELGRRSKADPRWRSSCNKAVAFR